MPAQTVIVRYPLPVVRTPVLSVRLVVLVTRFVESRPYGIPFLKTFQQGIIGIVPLPGDIGAVSRLFEHLAP